MVALTAFLAKHCTRSIPLYSQISLAAVGYIPRKQNISRVTRHYFPLRTMSSAKTLEEKIKVLGELSACDVCLVYSRLRWLPY